MQESESDLEALPDPMPPPSPTDRASKRPQPRSCIVQADASQFKEC